MQAMNLVTTVNINANLVGNKDIALPVLFVKKSLTMKVAIAIILKAARQDLIHMPAKKPVKQQIRDTPVQKQLQILVALLKKLKAVQLRKRRDQKQKTVVMARDIDGLVQANMPEKISLPMNVVLVNL